MKNIFHRSKEFVQKHKHHHHLFLAVLALAIAGTGAYTFRHQIASAATFNWTQTSWAGGLDTGAPHLPAVHATDQTGWTYYSATSSTSVLASSGGVSLASSTYSFMDDVATSTLSTVATGGGFSNGTNLNTLASTTIGSITLAPITNPISATGGTLTTSGVYNIHTFTATGTATFVVSSGSEDVDYLVVGGGGAAYGSGAGGGAGGFRTGILSGVTVGSYPVTVGDGGVSAGSNGQSSTFSTTTSAGGGGGAPNANSSGGSGGSGGGNGYYGSPIGYGNTPATTPSQGHNGAIGYPAYAGGGGAGANATTRNGAIGAISSIGMLSACPAGGTAPNCYYAGGGGAAGINFARKNPGGVGGLGGGGTGSTAYQPGTGFVAIANTGGGGGGTSLGLNGGSGIVIVRYATSGYYETGTFTSNTIDLGGKANFTSLSFASTTPSGAETSCTASTGAGCAIKIQIATSTSASGPWTYEGPDGSTSTYFTSGSGGTISTTAFDGARYVKYQATLSTVNQGYTPTLNSVTINYSQYALNGNLTSSAYNAGDDTNLISKISWTETSTSTSETIKFQVRSSPDGATWSSWCGYADSGSTCTGTNYFDYTQNGVAFATTNPLRSGNNDRYLQYKVFLSSGGVFTPTLTGVTAQYVVNAPPAFDATYGTNGVSVLQDATSTNATFGKVLITYKVRDVDTASGTTNPGFVTPSFEYSTNGGSTWTAIASSALATGDVSNKAVDGTVYNTYTATWSATTTVPGVSIANAQVRVTANDNEAANSIGRAISGNFTLDTTAPTVTALFDSSTGGATAGTVTVTASDTNTIQYRLCNDNTFPATDTQGNSCAWTTLVASPISSSTVAWFPTGSPSAENVYLQVRDLYANVTARTLTAPAMPANFITTDTTNLNAQVYREFLSWGVATSTGFGSYKVYSNTTSASGPYTLMGTVTDVNQNYYTDTIVTATSSVHYYKMVTVSSNNDISDFTAVKSDVPDGSGSTDVTPPYIPEAGIATSSVGNTTAVITFSTYTDTSISIGELATSTVYYGSYTSSVPGCSSSLPSLSVASNTFVVNHTVYLSGLTPSTNYYFCIKATDMSGNVSFATPPGGVTFTTVGGPIITGVTEREITDTSATIFWNTNTSSDSKVYFATSQAGVDSATPVSATTTATAGVGTPTYYQHQVGLTTGLSSGNTYYFKVSSTDLSSPPNTSTDNNSGQYYSFVTLKDTTPPVISGISTPVLAPDSAVIVWQTDEPATSQINWGTASSTYSHATIPDSTKSIYHVVTLSPSTNDMASVPQKLTADTTYHYQVLSNDAAGNPASSADQSLKTSVAGDVTITVVTAAPTAGTAADTTPPTISDVAVSDITPFGATVKFGTSKETVAFADYGKDTMYGDTAGDKVWGISHTIKFHGLTLGTPYHLMVSAIDKSGNTGTSGDQTFTTKFLTDSIDATTVDNIEQYQKELESAIESVLPSLVPPFVSKPTITDITESGATVNFKTNIKTFPVVVYTDGGSYSASSTTPYGTNEVSDIVNKTTDHTLALTGLKGNTTYHVQAQAFSLPKVIGKSVDVTFVTKASKIAGTITERKKDSFTVAWTTDEPVSSIVEYKNAKTGVTERKADDALRTSHSMRIENLPPGTTYSVAISGLTEAGNLAEAGAALSVTTSVDVTPPTITGFKVDNALVPGRTDRIQTIVSWTTDEPGTSTVYYEEGAGTAGDTKELANKNEELTSYVTNHSVILPSLKPGTIYRLKVTSSDNSGNEGSFGPRTVITPQQAVSITDIIFKNFEDSFKFLKKI